ncbi:uncharacterized protein LOC134530094 [Bacillus rossius redtenbacheri]|uniref:uncharacterized protein LOC134530094 n=1 Tax=Bacillus rossius redtenbacheri TaxID=93214 RepID=UPI002FDCCA36
MSARLLLLLAAASSRGAIQGPAGVVTAVTPPRDPGRQADPYLQPSLALQHLVPHSATTLPSDGRLLRLLKLLADNQQLSPEYQQLLWQPCLLLGDRCSTTYYRRPGRRCSCS